LLISSFAFSAALTALTRKVALQKGFVSTPRADRHNIRTVALGGGTAIFATLFLFLAAGVIVVKFAIAPGESSFIGENLAVHVEGFIERIPQLLVTLLCLAGLFAVGLYDDIKHLGPFRKLAIQFVVAIAAATLADIRLDFFIHNRVITTAMSAVWIVLIINAFNFLDNMDGLAGGIAVIVTSILLAAAVMSGQVFVSALAVLFIGTMLGFMVFNFPPAKIFMGDAGSLVMGFVVALLSLRTTYYQEAVSGQWYPVLLPLVVMAVPLYDFASVTFLRLMQGKSPFVGDTQHFSHRLRKLGLSDIQAVLTIYLATLCTGFAGTFLYQVNFIGAILIFIQTGLILAIIAIFEITAANSK